MVEGIKRTKKAKKAVKTKNHYYLYAITFLMSLILVLLFYPSKSLKKLDIITLNNDYYMSLNENYMDPGIEIKIGDEVLDPNLYSYNIALGINNKIPGSYEVEYMIYYDNNTYKQTRDVEVKDVVAPVITLSTDKVYVYSCGSGDKKTSLSFEAEDDYDGIITDKVDVEEIEDHYTISVSDQAGNKTSVDLPIEYSEKVPYIVLEGNKNTYLVVGSEYEELGATLYNGCGKKMKEDITIEGSVDTSTPGTYTITYSYQTDSKLITKKRKVVVYTPQEKKENNKVEDKIVYLTFDDGPGQYTQTLLDILDKYNVKATFFVTNQFKSYVPLIEKENAAGHTVAVHTLTHKWSVYDSVESYISDFNAMNSIIEEYTGKTSKIFRFPGGSSNTVSKGHSKGVVTTIANEMTARGYVYYDWNVDSEDAAGASSSSIYKNVTNGISKRSSSVVLMHDIKKNTIDVIEDIIKYGLENGYTFKPLSESTPTVHHSIAN